jgi:hypothetical protein
MAIKQEAHVNAAFNHYRSTQALRPGWLDRAFGNGVCRDPEVDAMVDAGFPFRFDYQNYPSTGSLIS